MRTQSDLRSRRPRHELRLGDVSISLLRRDVLHAGAAVAVSLKEQAFVAVVGRVAPAVALAHNASSHRLRLPEGAVVADAHDTLGVGVGVADGAATLALVAHHAGILSGQASAQVQVTVVARHRVACIVGPETHWVSLFSLLRTVVATSNRGSSPTEKEWNGKRFTSGTIATENVFMTCWGEDSAPDDETSISSDLPFVGSGEI